MGDPEPGNCAPNDDRADVPVVGEGHADMLEFAEEGAVIEIDRRSIDGDRGDPSVIGRRGALLHADELQVRR